MFNRLPKPFRNFYFLTAFFFLLWMLALDSNNLFTRYQLSSKLGSLENEKDVLRRENKRSGEGPG